MKWSNQHTQVQPVLGEGRHLGAGLRLVDELRVGWVGWGGRQCMKEGGGVVGGGADDNVWNMEPIRCLGRGQGLGVR